MAVRLIFLVCSAALVGAAREAHEVTPIEKVVSLLKKLSAQIAAEGKKEAAEYDKYSCFCKDQADEKLYAIETSDKKIGVLSAKIDQHTKDINALNQDISELSTKISNYDKDIKSATTKRDTEQKAYKGRAEDASGAISACERAIEAMKESKGNIDGKVDLAQLSASSPLLAAALMEQVKSKQEPASFAYSSNDILGTLEGLLAKFKANKVELDETEFNARSAFEMKVQSMSTQKSFAEKEKDEKTENGEDLGEQKAEATEEKDDETKARNADDEYMKVLTTECEEKAKAWDQRSSTRADEITAITKALDDLQKNASGNYAATGVGKGAASFLQLRGAGTSRIAATQSVLDLLLKKNEESNSPVLASISMKVMMLQQTGIDHFVKVRALIKDLVTKLKSDAAEEATQKAYCDTNIKKQTGVRDSSKLTIESKSADLTTSKAELEETKQSIQDLNDGISKNMKGLNEAMELRADAKAANDESIRMSSEGKKSVGYAITVLTGFYSKALVQESATYTPPKAGRDGKTVGDNAPEAFSGEYHGNQDASKGIIGILEVIQADFERTETQVKKDDAESEKDYQKFKKTTDEDNVAKKKELGLKKKKQTDLEDKITKLKDDKMAAEKSLTGAEDTLDDLKKMCIDGEETYAERVAKRKEEIDALKDALDILENWKQ